ncbi:D-alanine--D-alanine ligase [bacterium]|nr:D-alanine--D-alanine ligase [bacterium]
MIGVIYGGVSLEHDVSVGSAKDIIQALEAKGFYLRKDGEWEVDGEVVSNVVPLLKECKKVIPMIHGSFGENGVLQGFLEMNGIAYVGCKVSSSALCMDKDLTKRVLESHGVKTTPFTTVFSLEEARRMEISLPCVIKAASLGSSFGVYKVEKDPMIYFEKAFALCEKVLVEEVVEGRELWVSALEDGDQLILSDPCEIVPRGEVFTYENKYLEEDGATYHVPARDVDQVLLKEICTKVFQVLGCRGMARIDLFLTTEGNVLVNEVNTIPGFRKKSLFPKALIAKGYSYKEILSCLLEGSLCVGL